MVALCVVSVPSLPLNATAAVAVSVTAAKAAAAYNCNIMFHFLSLPVSLVARTPTTKE